LDHTIHSTVLIGYVILRKYGSPYRRVWSACFLTLLPPMTALRNEMDGGERSMHTIILVYFVIGHIQLRALIGITVSVG
jgi:hypothetical protein